VTERHLPWWVASGPDIPTIGLVEVAEAVDGGDGTSQLAVDARHIIVAIVAAKDSTFYPTAPLGYEFFEGNGDGTANLAAPIEPIYSRSLTYLGTFDTDGGIEPIYSYLYIVPVPTITKRVNYRIAGSPMGVTYAVDASIGVNGLTEVGTSAGATFDTPSSAHTIPEATGGAEGVNGLWLLAAAPAGRRESGDVAVVTWPDEQKGRLPSPTFDGEASVPGFILGDAGATSGGDLEFTFSEPGTISGVWLQLLPQAVPAVVTPPASATTTTVFNATTARLIGGTYAAPITNAATEFNADITLPSASREWRAVLVDSSGNTLARMPDAIIGDIGEVLNDTTTCTVTIPIDSPAGAIIDATQFCAGLEVQVWRGPTLWLWGPVTIPPITGTSYRLAVADAPWHLTQRHVGRPGNQFGGLPPYMHGQMENLRFERGDLSGWSILRTVSLGELPGFGTPDLDAIRLAPETHLPSGEAMARCVSPLDPLDNYQLFQDIRVEPPQNRRPLRMVLSGWWFIPSTGNYAPNNQRMGLVLATLLEDATLPRDYYLPQDVAFTTLDETSPRDELFYQECELEIPPGPEVLVHVAVAFPQGVSFIGGLDLQVDDGLLYNESPTTIGAGLVMHAQDAAFDRDDVNIDWWANTVGDQQIREYEFRQHTNIGNAIGSLAREGWFDWWCSYVDGARVMNFQARRRGSYRPRAKIRLTPTTGNVADIQRRRTSGATTVVAQTRSNGDHEHAARDDGAITLEEIFVADREPRDFDLSALAAERLKLTTRPEILVVDSNPGDERHLLGLEVGDTTDVVCTVPGHTADGRYRVTARSVDPTADSVKLTLHPEPTP
jgi:hypothetical protein